MQATLDLGKPIVEFTIVYFNRANRKRGTWVTEFSSSGKIKVDKSLAMLKFGHDFLYDEDIEFVSGPWFTHEYDGI